jgi:hypothetical protein
MLFIVSLSRRQCESRRAVTLRCFGERGVKGLRYGLAADCRRCSIELSLLCGAAIRSAIRFVERKVRAARKSYFACGCFIDLFDCSDHAPLAVTSHRRLNSESEFLSPSALNTSLASAILPDWPRCTRPNGAGAFLCVIRSTSCVGEGRKSKSKADGAHMEQSNDRSRHHQRPGTSHPMR